MYYKKKVILTLLILGLINIDSARILGYFPTPSISHQVVFRGLMHELAKRGHEVIVITPDPAFKNEEGLANLTEIDVHDVSYKYWRETIVDVEGNEQSIRPALFAEAFTTVVDLQLQNPKVKEVLNKDKNYFDVIFIESCVRVILGLANIFDAPIIQFSSFGVLPVQYNLFGAPMHVLLYPTPIAQRSYDLTLWEKGYYIFKYAAIAIELLGVEDNDYAVMRKNFGQNVPDFDTLSENIAMLFVNEHPIWSDNHPVTPNIIYVGGIREIIKNDLPEDLQLYLDSSKNGVIYVSFGTNIATSKLSPAKVQILIQVLANLPFNILLKWDDNKLPVQSNNIKTSKWFPQPDILRHPNVKLFITQGGLQSTEEAIDAGVPVLGIPILADQWYNVERYVYHGFGKQLDIETLTEDEFRNAITEIINDIRYKQNILRMREIMRDRPVKSLELAVWWTEHIIKFGGDHLKSPAANMGFAEYYELKLITLMFSIFATILCIIYLILSKLFKYLYWFKVKQEKSKIN